MEELKSELDRDVYQKLLDGNIDSLFCVLFNPISELHRLSKLPPEILEQVKQKASQIVLKNKFTTADKIPPWERFSTGCSSIDAILHGGFPINGITEIFGCSGVGKTQLCLQLTLMVQLPVDIGGKNKEVVYICTEDVFPSKRLHQLSEIFKANYRLSLDFQSRVYIEHVADFEQLRRCLCIKLPQLLRIKNIGLIIVDSIAGVFRSENADVCYAGRGQDIGLIAATLHNICDKYNIGIVCTNQVTENVSTGETVPCLGLAWSNYVTCRFNMSRYNHSHVREFEVVFAPDLPSRKCSFILTEQGVTAID